LKRLQTFLNRMTYFINLAMTCSSVPDTKKRYAQTSDIQTFAYRVKCSGAQNLIWLEAMKHPVVLNLSNKKINKTLAFVCLLFLKTKKQKLGKVCTKMYTWFHWDTIKTNKWPAFTVRLHMSVT